MQFTPSGATKLIQSGSPSSSPKYQTSIGSLQPTWRNALMATHAHVKYRGPPAQITMPRPEYLPAGYGGIVSMKRAASVAAFSIVSMTTAFLARTASAGRDGARFKCVRSGTALFRNHRGIERMPLLINEMVCQESGRRNAA